MQKNEYYGKAKGTYDYLKRAYLFYLNGDTRENVLNELESIYRETNQSIYSLIEDMRKVTEEKSKLKQKVWLWTNSQDIVNHFEKIVDEYYDFERLLNLSFMNLDGCIKLMEMHGDPQHIIQQHILDMNKLFKTAKQIESHFISELQSYTEEFKVWIGTEKHLNKKQQNMQKALEKLKNGEGIVIGKNLPSPPQKIYFTVENGETVSVFR